jgi:hypothetical protein
VPLELIVGAAVGAAVASPEVRRVVRRGVVYGLAGVLVACDRVASATHSAIASAREVAETADKKETKDTPATATVREEPVALAGSANQAPPA